MADFRLDRIRFTWRGPWNAETQYTKDDIVQYGGKTYVCSLTHVASETDFYNDFYFQDELGQDKPRWELQLDGYSWTGNWQTQFLYSLGDLVKYRGIVYRCINTHTSAATETVGLEDNQADWEILARGQNWLNNWTPFTDFKKDDVVKYNGIIYLCVEDHTSATLSGGLEVDLGGDSSAPKWVILSRSDSWKGDWQVSTRYREDDIVRFGGFVYRCIIGHTSENTIEEGPYNELGTDSTIPKWEIVYEGIQFLGYWAPATVYKPNDIVRFGPNLYRSLTGHNSAGKFDDLEWELWVPGLGYEAQWNEFEVYQPGDIVVYGGYSYTALKFNQNSLPAQVGKEQDGLQNDWELLTTGYNMVGEYDKEADYLVGSVVRVNGYVYVCEDDVIAQDELYPGFAAVWRLLVTGIFYRKEWKISTTVTDEEADNFGEEVPITYYPGDIVIDKGTAYICKTEHNSDRVNSRPSIDIDKGTENYWTIYIGGKDTNVLRYRGDIRTYGKKTEGGFGTKELEIGKTGSVLKVMPDTELLWDPLEETQKVYYVSLQGNDQTGAGFSPANPFRSVRYACQYISADVEARAPATIFVRSGIFEEILPIAIPRDTAIVGDELRSTVIQPAAGYELSNMFFMRNGSGLRNCTLQGLDGELGTPNDNQTQRPTAGAFVSLDPGIGPDSEYAWITNKSPYVQNVTTFGTGCTGLKIDGSLHNGGNKSIVANDFTQILSDGIGYWVANDGLSELVSVFTYYCHIGYLAEDGGKIRATNGNNSYGLYGSVAEGFDPREEPIDANVNNNDNQAQISNVISNGNEIFGAFFTHAGQNYTSASFVVEGSGSGANATFPEFRDEAVSEIRVTEESSNRIGGFGYQFLANNAQAGNTTQITLSGADVGTNELYKGMRIYIARGVGLGQYAIIDSINEVTKQVEVVKESNGEPGWEHVTGRPIATLLNESSYYQIEPRVIIDEPRYQETVYNAGASSAQAWKSATAGDGFFVAVGNGTNESLYSFTGDNWLTTTLPQSADWQSVTFGDGRFVAVAKGIIAAYSEDIENNGWTSMGGLPTNIPWNDVTFGNGRFMAVGGYDDTPSTNNIFATSSDGINWQSVNPPTAQEWTSVAYSPLRQTWVAVSNGNVAAYSTDDGQNWTDVVLPNSGLWTSIVWGYDRFVAVQSRTDSSPCAVAVSFDGVTWYESTIETGEFAEIGYASGLFVTFAKGTDIVAFSEDGFNWRSKIVSDIGDWTGVAGNGSGTWVSLSESETKTVKVEHGAQAKARVTVGTGRIGSVLLFNVGSHYKELPTIEIFDPESTADATFLPRLFNDVLPQPAFTNFGSGYTRAEGKIEGDGFANIYQVGTTLKLTGVNRVPGPGDNISIDEIDDVVYFVTQVNSIQGVGDDLTVELTISPNLGVQEAPEHGTNVTIRQQYSQVRLTGHDFLDIGTGNKQQTSYPLLYVEGYAAAQDPQPFNEVSQYNGGRVFYTSTDQDGNFRVGELFEVEQATGTISINAAYFDLSGLDELRLGGVVLGGTGAVIREFSTDGTFAANSNNIVPTQKAIATYVKGRVSSGGSDVKANRLNAGEISFFGNTVLTPTNKKINMETAIRIGPYVNGSLVAMNYFAQGGVTPGSDDDTGVY